MRKKNDNKLILILCDGKTDEITLHDCLKNYVKSKIKNLDIRVLKGDIAYKDQITKNNCLNEINKIINEFLKKNYILITDVEMIIHLIDTDCAFINHDNIVEDLSLGEYPRISEDIYYTRNRVQVLNKFINKNEIYQYLYNLGTIRNVPYKVFYFSRNIEHAIHNKLDVSKDDKINLAKNFDKEYKNDMTLFKNKIKEISFDVPINYEQSWLYIFGNNSFNRCSNLYLLLEYFDENL